MEGHVDQVVFMKTIVAVAEQRTISVRLCKSAVSATPQSIGFLANDVLMGGGGGHRSLSTFYAKSLGYSVEQ